MHESRCADDRIDRAGIHAEETANAAGLVDFRLHRRRWWEGRAGLPPEQVCQSQLGSGTAGRAEVDGCTLDDSFGVGSTAGVATLSTLGLW